MPTAKKKMVRTRVCLVAPCPPPYGGIAHWTSMIRRYAENRSDVELVSVDIAPRWRAIHHLNLFHRAFGGGLQLVRDMMRLLKAILHQRFDAIHLTTSGHLSVVRDVAVATVVLLFQGMLIYHIRFGRIPDIAEQSSIEWRLLHWVMRRAKRVVVIDEATLKAVQRFAPKVKVVLIPNCVNIDELPRQCESVANSRTILFIGWVTPAKGLGELIEAWKIAHPRGWKLEIVGPGSLDYRKSLVDRHEPENVEFVGELAHDAAMKRMAKCDVFVLPSYTEGFPNVIVEAMALGRPIIATDVGAIPEMLQDGAGILVKSRDVLQLAAAIEEVTGSTELREQLGLRASRRAKDCYAIDAVFERYMQIWKAV